MKAIIKYLSIVLLLATASPAFAHKDEDPPCNDESLEQARERERQEKDKHKDHDHGHDHEHHHV